MIRIFSEQELIRSIEDDYSNSVLISIGDPGLQINDEVKAKFKTILRLEFYDLEQPDIKLNKLIIPQKSDIDKVVEFYDNNKNCDFIVHCNAAVSRSPAIGLILFYLDSGSEIQAKHNLQKIRPKSLPNKRIIELADSILKSNLSKTNQEIWNERILSIKESAMNINI